MTRRTARRIAIVFFAAYTVALTYPGLQVANRIEPFVLGLPFNMAFVISWVALSFLVFVMLDRAHEAPRGDAPLDDAREAATAWGGSTESGGPAARDIADDQR